MVAELTFRNIVLEGECVYSGTAVFAISKNHRITVIILSLFPDRRHTTSFLLSRGSALFERVLLLELFRLSIFHYGRRSRVLGRRIDSRWRPSRITQLFGGTRVMLPNLIILLSHRMLIFVTNEFFVLPRANWVQKEVIVIFGGLRFDGRVGLFDFGEFGGSVIT